ncbi:hypothetical protein Pla175_48470 [Pirellulimonas nuda]|uniref:Uncharacterized protein n=1 Tax=Pirellulimonas nuda TaxID=2528009 RepID=A0A518DIX4_9BACT|nr:hypothetical protein [Pirellulimonas nuda]QDU91424.1 hypothetical protein Pla175_48470 [Pirellulimonas nuda]
MHYSTANRLAVLAVAALIVAASGSLALAQGAQGASARARVLAPGVLTTIPLDLRADDTSSKHDLLELASDAKLNWTPDFLPGTRTLSSKAKEVWFQRPIWQLEFEFKPLRMIYVDVPQPGGAVRRELVWYLVYRVRNPGTQLSPEPVEDGLYEAQVTAGGPIRFLPHFVLQGHDTDASDRKLYRAYLDRVIPAAVEPIRRRETPGQDLLDSVAISQKPLPPATGPDDAAAWVWGVATWEGIDPETDYFSIYVQGLTNAYRWVEDPAGVTARDAPGSARRFFRKTLQLNFWRPGDQFLEHESEVRFGAPPGRESQYGVEEGVAYQWVYR